MEKKAKKKKAKSDARKSKLDAAGNRAKTVLGHDSASDENEEVRASINSVEITPKKKGSKRKIDDDNLSRSDHFIAMQKVGIDTARAESEQCYKDAIYVRGTDEEIFS